MEKDANLIYLQSMRAIMISAYLKSHIYYIYHIIATSIYSKKTNRQLLYDKIFTLAKILINKIIRHFHFYMFNIKKNYATQYK